MCLYFYVPIFVESIETRVHAARDVVFGVDKIHKIDGICARHDAPAEIELSARRRWPCGFTRLQVSTYMFTYLSSSFRVDTGECDNNAAKSDVAICSACYGRTSLYYGIFWRGKTAENRPLECQPAALLCSLK